MGRFKIQSLYIKQIALNDDRAQLLMDLSDNGILDPNYEYEVYVNDSLYLQFKNPNPTMPIGIPVSIKKPKRWWPHNLGIPINMILSC